MGAHRALGGYCYSPSIDQSVKSKDDENWREPKGFFKLQTKEHGDALRLRRERLISRIIFEYLSVQLNAQQYYFKKKKKQRPQERGHVLDLYMRKTWFKYLPRAIWNTNAHKPIISTFVTTM
jgi:hypothetical protein